MKRRPTRPVAVFAIIRGNPRHIATVASSMPTREVLREVAAKSAWPLRALYAVV